MSITRGDITTLLPCGEAEFAFGRVSTQRAALSGTLVAQNHPNLITLNTRSLFATLIQVHNLWGQIARRVSRADRERAPWLETSEYSKLAKKLREFENSTPDRHRWSLWNFRGYKTESVELVCASCTQNASSVLI